MERIISIENIKNGIFPDNFDNKISLLIKNMINLDLEQRPTLDNLIKNKILL